MIIKTESDMKKRQRMILKKRKIFIRASMDVKDTTARIKYEETLLVMIKEMV